MIISSQVPRIIAIEFDYSDPNFLKSVTYFEKGPRLISKIDLATFSALPESVRGQYHPITMNLETIIQKIREKYLE